MEKSLIEDVISNLRNIYHYINLTLPVAFEQYARTHCHDDFEKIAGNPRFQNYIEKLGAFNNRYLEFKRIYHRLLIDMHRKKKSIS